MSTIKINELADGSLALNTLTVFADQNGLAFKRNLSDFKDFLATLDSLSFKGKLLIADTPLTGWYFAGESGTYTNVNDIVVDISTSLTVLIVSDPITDSSKVEIPVSLVVDETIIEDSTDAVSGGAVFDGLALKADNADVEPVVNFVDREFITNSDYFENDIDIEQTYDASGNLVDPVLGGGYRRSELLPISLISLIKIDYSIRAGLSAPYLLLFDENKTYITGSSITVTGGSQLVTGTFTKDYLDTNFPDAEYIVVQKNTDTGSSVKISNYEVPLDETIFNNEIKVISDTGELNEKPVDFTETNTGSFAYANNTYVKEYDVKLTELYVKGANAGTITLYACHFGDPSLNTELANGIAYSVGDNTLDISGLNITLPANFYLTIKGSVSNAFKTWANVGVPYSLYTYDSNNNVFTVNSSAGAYPVAYSFKYSYNRDAYSFKEFFTESIKSAVNDFRTKATQLFTVSTPFSSDHYFTRAGRLSLGDEYENLIFINGQSNADGRAKNDTMPSNIVDVDGKLENFMMWNHTTNEFQTYQLGVCTGADNIDGSVFGIYDAFGFEVFFAKKWLTDNPGKKLYAVKTTLGGTGIYPPANGKWNPLGGTLVDSFQLRLNKALTWGVKNAVKFAPMGVLYHQGEWDGDQGTAGVDAYKQNVSNLFAHFRGFIGGKNMPIINGQLSTVYSSGGRYAQINTIFSELNALDPWFKTVDMSANQTFVPVGTDGIGDIHYDATALKFMGEEMYDYYKELNLIS